MVRGIMKRMSNPFKFGSAVTGDQYYDRTIDGDKLYSIIAGGSSNVVLYAPRRYGKTSLVKKVIEKWADDGFTCLYFDMMKIDSIESFCEKYASAVYVAESATDKIIRLIGSCLSGLRPKFTVDESGKPTVELDFTARRFSGDDLENILDLPEKVAGGKRTFVIIFDEFQEIASWSGGIPLEGVFRGCIQHHDSVRYVFLGSKTHMLQRMFSDHARPFYNSARILHLDKPPVEESRRFVADRFASVEITIGKETIDKVLELSQNIPYYVQALSSEIYETVLARGGKKVVPEDVDIAVMSLVDMKREQYEIILEELSGAQRRLLSALAISPTDCFDEAYRQRFGLGQSSTVHGALLKLMAKGYCERLNAVYFVGDPFFAKYLTSASYEIHKN